MKKLFYFFNIILILSTNFLRANPLKKFEKFIFPTNTVAANEKEKIKVKTSNNWYSTRWDDDFDSDWLKQSNKKTNPKGSIGVPGPKGDVGPQGERGLQGAPGPKGDVGPQGERGLQGVPGLQGERGLQGVPGLQGERGLQGEPGPKGDSGTRGLQGAQGSAGEVGNEQLVFTAANMYKAGQAPDTAFKIYSRTNFKIQAWKLKSSKTEQQEISLIFGLPSDYDSSKNIQISFYLVVQKNIAAKKNILNANNAANIRIRMDSKSNYQEIGTNFLASDSTGNFIVTEPKNSTDLEGIIVTATLPKMEIVAGNLMLFVFDRIAPILEANEYGNDIYLTSVVVRYSRI